MMKRKGKRKFNASARRERVRRAEHERVMRKKGLMSQSKGEVGLSSTHWVESGDK